MCSMSRAPRREECTICTALAPNAVLTVRTYATADSLETSVSAHIHPTRQAKPQVSDPHTTKITDLEPSQDHDNG